MSDVVAPVRLTRAFTRSRKTYAEVASACGCSSVAVKCWLRGTRKPRHKYWGKLAGVLGVTPSYFVGDFTGE
jgi:transcriptional regulator with XRE-family HTH domain